MSSALEDTNLSFSNPDLSQLNPDLSQLNPDLSRLNPELSPSDTLPTADSAKSSVIGIPTKRLLVTKSVLGESGLDDPMSLFALQGQVEKAKEETVVVKEAQPLKDFDFDAAYPMVSRLVSSGTFTSDLHMKFPCLRSFTTDLHM